MRIALDARFIADHFPGIGRYVYSLAQALATTGGPHELLLLHNPAQPDARFDITALGALPCVELVAVAAPPFSPAAQFEAPRLLRRLRADLFHAPYYFFPYAGLPCPAIVTLYDVIPRIFPAEIPPRARLAFDMLQRLAVRRARRVIAISQSAAAGLTALYRIPAERISVTPLAVDPAFAPPSPAAVAVVRARYGLPEHYALSLSSNKPHKNIETLVAAWALPGIDAPLVIAGRRDPRYCTAEARARDLGLGDRMRFIGEVAEADLPALYGGAALFIFPSLYEGFGLPPLEALACGAPVVCGGHSSLPEVVGDAALIVDVRDPAAIAAAAGAILANAALAGRLRSAGVRQAARFSWRRTAELTLAAYAYSQ
jgi:alpha-1,3-rhamnosyl/mannosyltransferase